ncbi:MAG: hypothetical protein OXM61_06335 [Candidatus Poribacteria bacterium]|nr:hypothetical protein [Candidatus Poribacteria bacterium]
MQPTQGITASAFRMKFFKLFLLAALSAIILTGCERRLVSPIDPTGPSQTTAQFAQMTLSDLANTAAECGLVDLANAASGVAEVIAIDNGTSVEPTFSKIAKLAQLAHEVTALEQVFVEVRCKIELQNFAEALMDTVKVYAIWETAEMERTLLKFAQEAVNAEMALRQLPTENAFIPFTFGYGQAIDVSYYDFVPKPDLPMYEIGVILIQYDNTVRPWHETQTAVIEFLNRKGYTAQVKGELDWIASIDLGADVDPLLIMGELISIPGLALVQPNFYYEIAAVPPPRPSSVRIIDHVSTAYNAAWCHHSFDGINSILIEVSGLDFFDYAFVRNLADIYAEEIPETAERIRTNNFSLRSIAIAFLEIYFQESEKKTLEEIIELFRQSVKTGYVSISIERIILSIERTIYSPYYVTTDYWKQLVTDHLNQ